MSNYELLDDLYSYNDWANQKVLALCDGLTDAELDQGRDIGLGSLRAVLFHVLTAERVWMDRWTGVPWRPFPFEPNGVTLDEIREGLEAVAAQRRSLIELHRADRWREPVTYQNIKQIEFTHELFPLLLHVANHGVHHRAQALHYLKRCGRVVPGGIDYLFYRLAVSTLEQPAETVEKFRAFGMDVATAQSPDPSYDRAVIKKFFSYGDWANSEVLEMCGSVEETSLDRDFEMGPGTIRKTLLHLLNADQWWVNNWTDGPGPFPESPPDSPIKAIKAKWAELRAKRDAYLATLDEETAQSVVPIRPVGALTNYHAAETALQVPLHATHHRSQIINMVKRAGGEVRDIDLLYSPS
ncbi:MAG: DinB family protein [Planctomycetota bacterium]